MEARKREVVVEEGKTRLGQARWFEVDHGVGRGRLVGVRVILKGHKHPEVGVER